MNFGFFLPASRLNLNKRIGVQGDKPNLSILLILFFETGDFKEK